MRRPCYSRSMKRALPSLAVAAVFGCGVGCGGATTAFTLTGPTLPAQPDQCEFAVVSTFPSQPITELGTVDIKYMKQTDWIYDEKAFKRKVRTDVCRSGGDTVFPHINDNGLYTSATVLTTKVPPEAAAPSAPATPAPSEPEATAEVAQPAPPPATTAPAAAPDKGAQAAAKPAKKADGAKDAEAAKPAPGKKGNKKGASAKKDDDIHGKDGKVDIDKLL
jgi:hypothetical protein